LLDGLDIHAAARLAKSYKETQMGLWINTIKKLWKDLE
jgi:hypothetical protein